MCIFPLIFNIWKFAKHFETILDIFIHIVYVSMYVGTNVMPLNDYNSL